MPFKEMSTKQLAKEFGIDEQEVKGKQRLSALIVKARKTKRISQAALAKKMSLTQARIAQIESGIGTAKITFDGLFGVLAALGYSVKVQVRKAT